MSEIAQIVSATMAVFKEQFLFAPDTVGKSKQLSHNLSKTILDLHKPSSFSETMFKQLKVPWASVQATVCKNKNFGTTHPVLFRKETQMNSQGWTNLGLKVQLNPKTTAKEHRYGLSPYSKSSIQKPECRLQMINKMKT